MKILTTIAEQVVDLPPPKAFFESTGCESASLSPDGLFIVRFNHSVPDSSIQVASTLTPNKWVDLLKGEQGRSISLYQWSQGCELIVLRDANMARDAIVIDCQQFARSGDLWASSTVLIAAIPVESHFLGLFTASSAGKYIAYVCPGEIMGYKNVEAISVLSGQRTLIYTNKEQISLFHGVRPDGAVIGTRARFDGGVDLLLFSNGTTTLLATTSSAETVRLVGFGEGGDTLIASNIGQEFDKTELIAISENHATWRVLDRDPLAEVDFGSALLSYSGELLGTTYFNERLRFNPKTAEAKQVYTSVATYFPEADVDLIAADCSRRFWLLHAIFGSSPGSYWLWDQQSQKISRLTNQEEYPSGGNTNALRYRSRDGIEITAYLTLPNDYPGSNLPTIVFPHGGPRMRTYWGMDGRVQFFASRGYAVFQPNYRGSNGFGKRFISIANKQYGKSMQHDITDGVEYLISQGISDPKRIGIFGGSYGGYCAFSGLAFTPHLYAAGVSFFGISDLHKFIVESSEEYLPFMGQMKTAIGDPADSLDLEMLQQSSPVNAADNIVAPLLLYHGRRDRLVPPIQSDYIFQKLSDPHRMVEYYCSENEAHGFSDPLNEEALFIAVERFFARHLGGLCSPVADPKLQRRLDRMKAEAALLRQSHQSDPG